MISRSGKYALLGLAWALASGAAWAQLPEGQGKQLTISICGKCHQAELVKDHRQGAEEWAETIVKMVKLGASGTEEQLTTILDYLVKNFGPPIRINQAAAEELESGLDIAPHEAAAIVKYRAEKGPFQSIDDLKKVPGLDFQKIEARKDRLVF